jgi:hypothetical protein
MREPEGIPTPAPGRFWKRAWSKGRDLDIRNVEAVGSNPIASTKWAEGGIPVKTRAPKKDRRVFTCLYVSLWPMVVLRWTVVVMAKTTEGPRYPRGRHDHPTPERPVAPAGVRRGPPGHLRDLSHRGFGR